MMYPELQPAIIGLAIICSFRDNTVVITCMATMEDGTELKASVPAAMEVALAFLSAETKAYSVYAGYSLEPIEEE